MRIKEFKAAKRSARIERLQGRAKLPGARAERISASGAAKLARAERSRGRGGPVRAVITGIIVVGVLCGVAYAAVYVLRRVLPRNSAAPATETPLAKQTWGGIAPVPQRTL